MTKEDWQKLQQSELALEADRDRRRAVSRFYSGRALQKLLHPKPPAPHSPALYTDIPNCVTMTGDSGALAVYKEGLNPDTVQLETLQGTLRVSGIHPTDLYQVLFLAERAGLKVGLASRKRLVQGAADRLCVWESVLAAEAKASKARCARCAGRHLIIPVSCVTNQTRTVRWWCVQCSRF